MRTVSQRSTQAQPAKGRPGPDDDGDDDDDEDEDDDNDYDDDENDDGNDDLSHTRGMAQV